MESRMMELMEAIQESEGQAERRVLTLLGGRYISEKALVIDGKIVWESRKNGYFHGYTDEIKNITESGITYIGNEKVFCDTLGQEKQIVICGAGHVSIPVIKMAVMMDCEVIVLEDRPMYADHARMAGASQVICEPFEEALDKIQGSADTYFVILTRGHRYDQICLEKIAAKEHAYIGMIGSRRRTALVKQSLAEKGVDQEVLDAVYTPIGLDIGAQTPAEIGVAIIAEIIEEETDLWIFQRNYACADCSGTVSGKEDNGNDHYQTWFRTTGAGNQNADIQRWPLRWDDRRRMYGSKSHPDCQTYGSRRGRTGKDLPCRHDRK